MAQLRDGAANGIVERSREKAAVTALPQFCHPGSREAAIRDPLRRLQDGSRLSALLTQGLAGMTI
jgi:hypothetical protein